ncbi:MAG: carbohydrate kinase family protein [Bacillati bacterium ANGP1]|uniref:Carbohydrate kinase family protein n=1 Tax=Candidatus Segetimicrobium genomatis TaxID=2569760 RepID=A0A537KX72_9BACT|nr:MAG: carbohydrate kinase family protein [Terrabacteria group bacterium ANGP1]
MATTEKRPIDAMAVSAASIDHVIRVRQLPAFDEKVIGALVGRLPGGTMANFACALSRLGGRAAWMGTVGGDPEGAMLLRDFRRFRVDTQLARVDRRRHSNFTVIFLGPSAERAIVVVPSIRERLPAPARLRRSLTRARFLYLSPHDMVFAERLSRIARKAGCRVAVEVEPTADLRLAQARSLLRHTDVLAFNRDGLAMFLGIRTAISPGQAERHVRRLLSYGPRYVAVTLGRHGAILAGLGEVMVHPGFRVNAVDTTGAGDCFSAALILGLCRGWPLPAIASYANAAAALSTTGLGPRGFLPSDRDVRRLLRAGARRRG